MTPPIEQETLFAELDQLLEPEIEARLRSGIYGEKKRPLVQLYLDQKALVRSQAAQADQAAIARSARNAAWVAALAAVVAAIAAVLAYVPRPW
jgi:hypothetical protein